MTSITLYFNVYDEVATPELQRQARELVIAALMSYVQSDDEEISDADEALIDAILNVDINPPGDERRAGRELTLNSLIHLAELGMMRDQIAADVDKLRGELDELNTIIGATADENAIVIRRERTAGMWLALRGLLSESIDPMLEGWRKNEPQSRAAEIILNNEDRDPV